MGVASLSYQIDMNAVAKKQAGSDGHIRMTYGELQKRIVDFLHEAEGELSTESIGTYRRSLNEFERWFLARKGRFFFTTEHVQDYRDYLDEERGLSSVSISTYLTALRRFCRYLVERGIIDDNPARAVRGNPRPSDHTRAVLTEEEIQRLHTSMEAESQIGKRDIAIVYLMLYAGLSEIEVARANIGDLEQTLLGWFLRVQGKGRTSKDQQVQIDPPVMEKIRIYLDTRGRIRPEKPLVVSHGRRSDGTRLNTRSIRARINGHYRDAGIVRSDVTPHSLTHTAAMLWLRNGMAEEEVRRRMRHGTLDTTRIYSRLLEEAQQ